MSAFRRSKGQRPLIHGHRGVRGPVVENTMRSFAHAKEEGADGLELDVRLSKNGEVMVFHDPTLTRMTHGFDARDVATLSTQELALIDLGPDRIPTLNDVLDWLAPTALLLNVEIKHDAPDRPALVWAVAKMLNKRRKLHERLLISSFDPFMLTPLNVLLPLIPKALLFHAGQAHLHPWTVAKFGPWQAAHPEHVMIDGPLHMRRIVNAWTLNDVARAKQLAEWGVDGLITDSPALLLAAFASQQP